MKNPFNSVNFYNDGRPNAFCENSKEILLLKLTLVFSFKFFELNPNGMWKEDIYGCNQILYRI